MEEEKEDNKQHKIVTSIGDAWIICRSQSHSGRIYYFNTLTGKAVWNLSDSEMKKAHLHTLSIQGEAGISIENCPEPIEPPMDMPQIYQQTPGGPRIYNKQISNNQFSNPYTVPFANPLNINYNSLNNMSNGSVNVVPPVYNPNIWTIPPTQPMFLTPVVSPFANQPLFNNIGLQSQAVGLQSQPVGLPNFQVATEFTENRPYQGKNFNARMNQRFSRNFQNESTHDLRNVLSARRKVSLDNQDVMVQGECNDRGNPQDAESINEADLYPSDIDDEWLQAYTGNASNKLNLTSVWVFASGDENKDCWFIVVSAMVLLNHMKFLNNLINSDASARALAPLGERKRLRSAAGAGRAGPRARRAARLAALLMNRVPAGLDSCQSGSIFRCCVELVQRNYYVIHLTDESDLQKNESELRHMNNVPVFTVDDLKQYLTRNYCAPPVEPRNITVTVSPENHGSKHPETTTPNTQTPETLPKEASNFTATELPSQITKEKAEENPPKKRTASVSVQTDSILEPTSSSASLNSLSHVETLQINHSFNVDIVLQSNSCKDETQVKKIKLNRVQFVKKEDSVKKPFKWRKRRAAPNNTSVTDPIENSKNIDLNIKQSNSSPLSFADLYQQSDNAVDCVKSIEMDKSSAVQDDKEKDVSTSDAISNSVESDSMFKINRKAITSRPSRCEKDIVMFEVTGDQMDDYLSKGCEEWLSRFVQIMEEALTQILQQEPAFADAALPPPWTIHEAAVCVEMKFGRGSDVSYACRTLLDVLHEISDDRGKIYPNLDPSTFMKMYSYGVHLIEALQSELQDSEDIKIAKASLSKLLSDIRNPNLDGSHNVFTDTFNGGDEHHFADGSETRIEDGLNIASAEDSKKRSPRKKAHVLSNNCSPAKYNLRSLEQKRETQPATVKSIDEESSFFTRLGLRKNVHVNGPAITVSFENSGTDAPPSPALPETVEGTVKPTIIRKFKKCTEYEEELERRNTDREFTEDNDCPGNRFYLEDGYSDGDCEPSSKCIDAALILDWFVKRTTGPVHNVLMQTHKFCMDTKEELKHKDKLDRDYKTSLFEKTIKLNTHLGSLCKYLNSVHQRKDMKSKFRDMMRELHIEDFAMDDTQRDNYRCIIGKYLVQAVILLESVNCIARELRA